MNLQFSTGAWIALICLAGIVISSGLILWSAWHQRNKTNSQPSGRSQGFSFTHGWEKEDEEIKKLADAVKNLKENKKDST